MYVLFVFINETECALCSIYIIVIILLFHFMKVTMIITISYYLLMYIIVNVQICEKYFMIPVTSVKKSVAINAEWFSKWKKGRKNSLWSVKFLHRHLVLSTIYSYMYITYILLLTRLLIAFYVQEITWRIGNFNRIWFRMVIASLYDLEKVITRINITMDFNSMHCKISILIWFVLGTFLYSYDRHSPCVKIAYFFLSMICRQDIVQNHMMFQVRIPTGLKCT